MLEVKNILIIITTTGHYIQRKVQTLVRKGSNCYYLLYRVLGKTFKYLNSQNITDFIIKGCGYYPSTIRQQIEFRECNLLYQN